MLALASKEPRQNGKKPIDHAKVPSCAILASEANDVFLFVTFPFFHPFALFP